MIVFDLRCGNAHVFEAWFGSTGDYEAQGARGLIGCPICGSTDIVKAAMAPAVPAKSNRRNTSGDRQLEGRPPESRQPKGSHPDSDLSNGNTELTVAASAAGDGSALPPAEVKAMLSALAAAQAHVEANCDYVGKRFAATARAIHDGEAASRGIFGEATRAEVAALIDDGIAVAPLPFRSRRNSDA